MSHDDRTVFLTVVCCVLALVATIGILSSAVPHAGLQTPENQTTSDRTGFERAHAAGFTGENVTVGVVDVTGFDTGHDDLSGHVADARAFGRGATVRNGGQNAHGTAAAAGVARVAPDADLFLAAFESPGGYVQAIKWLIAADVDVIVAPVSFYGTPGDGSARVARVATEATRQGVVFVAPVGNLAQGHWEGRYQPLRDGTHQFEGGPKNDLRGDAEEVVVWLSWDRAHRGQDYTVELYRRDGQEVQLVARSVPYWADGIPNERIVARPREGSYFVVVRGPPAETGVRLELTSPTHDFEFARPAGSVTAPATAKGVLAVGAYDPRSGRVEPFSSRGPTGDGRLGVDIIAPDRQPIEGGNERFVGSSAAAPYVGGVSALVLDAAPCLSPTQIERQLERTAADTAEGGPDETAGYGRVRPWPAVDGVDAEC